MSSKYQAERLTWEATKLLLSLVKRGIREIAPLRMELESQGLVSNQLQLSRLAKRLVHQNILQGGAREGYEITKTGLQKLMQLELKQISEPAHWDGLWRLILFDIPESKRPLRDELRRLIKELGCQKIQQSIWVHPFDCLSRFEQIRQAYGEKNHIILLEVTAFEQAAAYIIQFQELYPHTNFK